MSDSISPLSNAMITHDSLVIEWFLPGSTRYPHHPEPRGDPSRANQRLGTNLTLELGSKEKRPENSNMNVKICRWIDICICMDLFQTRPGESFPGVKQLSFSRHFFGPVSRSPAPKGRGKNSGANRKPVSGVDFPPVTLSLSLCRLDFLLRTGGGDDHLSGHFGNSFCSLGRVATKGVLQLQ